MCSNRTSRAFAAIGLFVVSGLVPAQAANVLVVAGTDGIAQAAAGVLSADLGGTNTVTVVNTGVPASLAGFTQIYDVRYNNLPAFTVGEMNQYLAFLQAAPNNTLFLMGENSGLSFTPHNILINQFITLAGGGIIAAPAVNSPTGSETLAPQFATTPNVIATVKYAACGLVTSTGTGAFASSEAGGGCSLFFGLGALASALQGALVVVYDVNFIATAPSGGAVNEIAFRQNLEHFVSAPPVAPPPATTPPTQSVPTLSVWGQITLALALCAVGAIVSRRRTFA